MPSSMLASAPPLGSRRSGLHRPPVERHDPLREQSDAECHGHRVTGISRAFPRASASIANGTSWSRFAFLPASRTPRPPTHSKQRHSVTDHRGEMCGVTGATDADPLGRACGPKVVTAALPGSIWQPSGAQPPTPTESRDNNRRQHEAIVVQTY
jgi:hypothetical protein